MVAGASSMALPEVSANPKVVTSADSVVSFGASEVALAVVCSDNRSSHKHNSILLAFYNPNHCEKGVFFANTQFRFASVVLDAVLGPPRLARHTCRCPSTSGVVDATHKANQGPLKGAVSAQKAIQGSKTETRELLGGTKESSVSPMRGN